MRARYAPNSKGAKRELVCHSNEDGSNDLSKLLCNPTGLCRATHFKFIAKFHQRHVYMDHSQNLIRPNVLDTALTVSVLRVTDALLATHPFS